MYKNAPSFDCSSCPWGYHCDNEKLFPKSKGAANHNKFIIRFGSNNIESNVCFLPMITPELDNLMNLYDHYKSGYLYKSGGVVDQPVIYLDFMSLIDAVINGE